MANKARVLRQKQLCEFCKKEFLPSKDGRKFCSSYCYNQTRPKKIKNCPTCNKEFIVPWNKRNKKFCNKSCANSGEFNVMFGKTGGDSPSFGRKAWNNGLTKETDERLKNLGNKISKTQKEQFKKGKRSNKGKNN